MCIYIYIHTHIYKYVNQQTHHEQLCKPGKCGGTTKNHRRRNSSLLEHINLSPGIKKIAADLLKTKMQNNNNNKN